MAVRALDQWNRWGIQILLLLSLSLQLLLHPLAGVRRRRASGLRRGLLWLAYQMANLTAIYGMGHLTLTSPARERRLTAFWAPFLVLHQGGPDSIGAYALQDSQLWLRHLKLLIVQALAAAYVLFRHLPRGNAFLQLSAFLMWAVGIAKYAERVVALKRGNLDSIRSSLKKQPAAQHHHHLDHLDKHTNDAEAHLRHAHHLFHISKREMVDSWLEKDPEHGTLSMLKALRKKDSKGMWAFVEMVMSLMYDVLYTKAAVIHTWPGYLFRLTTSSLAVPASFLLFHFSGKAGHSKVDVAVSYTLLAGAFLVEVTSLLGAVGSTWAYAFLSTTRWSWIRYAVLCSGRWDRLRRLVQGGAGGRDMVSNRRWSGKIGQYNMLHFSSRRNKAYRPVLGRVATMFGFEEFWNRKHYSAAVDVPDDLKRLLFEYIRRITDETGLNRHGAVRKSWGQEALEAEDRDLYERMKKNRNLGDEFQEGVIIWHIGSDIFLAKRNRDAAGDDAADDDLVKFIRMLSNYIMFLLVDRPNMLPGLAQTTVYHRTCKNLSDRCRAQGHPSRRNICSVLKEVFRVRDGPEVDEQRHVAELASIVYKERPQYSPSVPRLSHANGVADELLNREKQLKGSDSVLKLLFDVWMDFLVYAANRCSRESHAKKLSRGGELTTLVWVMTHYLNQEAYVGQKE